VLVCEIERYLAERKRAPLMDMATRFETDVNALRGMLALLERKGRVRRLTTAACTTGCNKCGTADMELYEVVER
jgi:hypothetical protein